MSNKLKRSILIVDDEKLIRVTLSKILAEAGYDVMSAENGGEAKNIINENQIDLVITDIVMKGVGGIEVLRHVKDVSPDTIVIVMTAYASMESTIEALRKGAYDYLIKPCNNEEVLMRIAKGIEKKEIIEKLRESERQLALSQLAVAINHEINSPLTVMVGNTEVLLSKKLKLPDDARALLENVISAGNKIKNIVSRLRQITDTHIVQYADDATMIDLKPLEQAIEPAKTREKKPSILIADDEELILELFHTALEDDYNVYSVLNGDDLFSLLNTKKALSEKIDVFFLDLYMPGSNGLEIFRALKKMDPTVKVCFITGYINDDLVKQAMAEGALGYIYKPFKLSDVTDLIEKLLVIN